MTRGIFSRWFARHASSPATQSPRPSRPLRFENLEGRELLAVVFDPYFGDGGKVLEFTGSSAAQTTVVQRDGKIIVAGKVSNGATIALARYKPSGDLDSGFGNQGLLALSVPVDVNSVTDVALQSDGKIIVMGSKDNAGNADFFVARLQRNGELDTSFAGTGMVETPIGGGDDFARGVAVQSDGKIVVAGYAQNGSGSDMVVVRYQSNGSLDPQFAGTGMKTFALGAGANFVSGIRIQSDGKIVLAGSAFNSSAKQVFAVARLNANGSFDTTFSGDGKQLVAFSTEGDYAQDLVLQADGKIVVAGGSQAMVAVVRLRTNGTLDPTFSTDGRVTVGLPNALNSPAGLAVQSDGKLLVVGFSYNVVRTSGTVFRFNVNGTLDASFDGDGKRLVRLGESNNLNDVAVLPNGSILAAGSISADSTSSFLLCKFAETRPVITSFVVPNRASFHQRVFLSATATDPNQSGTTLVYTWTITGSKGFKLTLKGRNVSFVASQAGTLSVSLVVTDNEGLTARVADKIIIA